MIRRSKRALKQWRMVKALDADCRERVVIERDHNTCQRCGRKEGEWDPEIQMPTLIQWCHVHTREDYSTRWEEDNSFAGCMRCHTWFDHHKVLSFDWFAKRWPERWERIQRILQAPREMNSTVRVRTLYADLQQETA